QAGLKTSIPMWRTFPDVQSSVLNLNGLAHKISFESEYLYADTTRDLDQFPLYNPIDDNSQEHFRRRLVFNTFGGVLPDQFESTNYAARQSMQRYVSAASSEVVTNQLQSRFGIHQRLQTKRGVAGRERIADVVEFDVDAIFFGKPDRDNFGESVGGINYDFRYHIGDRVTLISDGYYDLFKSGLMATTLGGVLSRPGRGEIYLGVTSLEGPISSLLLTTSFNYRMNEKWVAVGGTSMDLGKTGNIGQSLGLTRIGESFLIRVGATVDNARRNFAFNFSIEPRFFQRQGLGVVAGQLIPPAGLYGLE
ncbi:MAG TPA: organic solvent tolerance protein OstA, partial [Pirellula sp.]|nr:organic solvent tolerance protein OstA [Pirellula sp.]